MKLFFVRLLFLSCISTIVWAEAFRIDDIRIEGLQRVSASKVFSALPIKTNTDVSQLQIQDAVRELFKTGFFADIDIGISDNVLIINVVERPAINRIVVLGNKVIETEPLLEGLKNIGLVEGEIFKQESLQEIARELSAQYSSIGRYATVVETKTIELKQNQVNVGIKIDEGKVATIKHINIVGNKQFSESDLQGLFEIKTTGAWSWLSGNDKYAKQILAGDLDRLKAFYFNQGYLEFDITSTQVSLSPDKDTVFITINVAEGEQYKVQEVKLAGDPIVSEGDIKKLITIKQGDIFSQQKMLDSSEAIKRRLGNEGYSFAKVNGVPDLEKQTRAAKITFFINPGEISYVRRIIFKGNTTTQDKVLRREMRQLEGAPVSSEKLERSKTRLQRLTVFSQVQMATKAVPGRPDQIDIIFSVVEQPSGSVNASLGFSQGSGVSLGAGVQQENWLGTGNTFGFQVDKSDTDTNFNVNFSNPYFTQDGVSRGISLFYRERDFEELTVSSFATDRYGFRVNFGYPISENSRLSLGFGYENITVNPGNSAVQEIIGSPRQRSGIEPLFLTNSQFLTTEGVNGVNDTNNNGFLDERDTFSGDINELFANNDTANQVTGDAAPLLSNDLATTPEGFLDRYGDDFGSLNFTLGWSESTLNRGIFPTKGGAQSVNFEITAPGGDLEFYKLTYRNQFYKSISKNLTFRFKSRFGYAASYGDIDELPFFENFFSGGSSSVRGFEQSSLGPKGTPSVSYVAAPFNNNGEVDYAYVSTDGATLLTELDTNDTQTIGGNILVELGAELIFPVPFTKGSKSLRTLFFVDAGNVFSDSCSSGQRNCSDIDLNRLSASAGLGLQWLSPVGPLSLYFSKALQEQPLDETESFQFSLGQRF